MQFCPPADTYPRFSEDGTKVAFSRSREPWVSQRNFDKWDAWVLDLATGEETLVATNAYQACWSGNDLLFFVGDGGRKLAAAVVGRPHAATFLKSGVPPLDEGVLVTLPDRRFSEGEDDFALTLRGKRRATAFFSMGNAELGVPRSIREVAGGCQMVWMSPEHSDEVAWIDHPGRGGNAIYARRADEGPRVLLDAPEPWSHEYFPRFCGRWLVYGASTGGHEQDSEDYEIFLWDTEHTDAPPARLTFHTGNDCWPDHWW